MDTPQPLFNINTSIARDLEAYVSFGADLHYVMKVTHSAVKFLEEDQEDDFTLQTYLSAALAAYARPFKDGVRGAKKLNLEANAVYGGVEGAENLHKYLINQRDKFVAHSVNPFETTNAGVILNNKGRPVGVGCLSSRLTSFTLDDYRQFNQLAKIALEAVNNKILVLQEQLLEEAQKFTDVELSLLKPMRFTTPLSDEAGSSKRRPKKG